MRTDAARNRARILAAARDLVAEHGPDVPMEAIAGRAGVAVGTLYRHHPTKAALLRAVVTDSAEELAGSAAAAVDEVRAGADAGEAFTGMLRAVADRLAVDRTIKDAAAALGEQAPSDPADYAPDSPEGRAAAALGDLLGRAQAAGAVRVDVSFEDLVLLVSSLPGPEVGTERRARFVDVVLSGLRPPR